MKLTLSLAVILVSVFSVYASDVPTARQAVEIANRRVSPASQNEVLRIEGDRSDADLRIRRWDITFYDDTRINNALTIRIEDGRDTKVDEPLRMFENGSWDHFGRNFTGYSRKEVIDLSRWKIDSDEAVRKVLKLPKFSEVQVTDVRMAVRKLSDGDVPPVWRVHMRARSRRYPSRDATIGSIDLSGESGEILRDELRLGKLRD